MEDQRNISYLKELDPAEGLSSTDEAGIEQETAKFWMKSKTRYPHRRIGTDSIKNAFQCVYFHVYQIRLWETN